MLSKYLRRVCAPQKCMNLSTLTRETRIGLVGLGNVGTAIAKNLLKSDLKLHSVFDINQDTMAELPGHVKRAASAKDLAENSDVVLTALPTPESVKAAMEGEKGVLVGIQKDSVWIDHSTTGQPLHFLHFILYWNYNLFL